WGRPRRMAQRAARRRHRGHRRRRSQPAGADRSAQARRADGAPCRQRLRHAAPDPGREGQGRRGADALAPAGGFRADAARAALMKPVTVGLASAATVAAEVLLVRRLGIEHFHHFAYLAVGVAMLGYGVSGTALATVPARPGWFRLAAASCAISLVAAPILAGLVRVDATQLAWSAAEWPRLALLIAVLATPFAAGGAVTLLAVSSEPQ